FWDWWTGKTSSIEEIPYSDLNLKDGKFYYRPYDVDGNLLPFIEVPLKLGDKMDLSRFRESYTSKKTFLLGTDKYGRDLLSRMIVGTRVSISIGFVTVFISLFIGIFLGAVAGYYGGKIDAAIMWLINVTWSIPTLLMVIAISIALGKGFLTVFIAVGLTMWVEVARVVRGQIIVAKEYQYVTAAKALGFNNFRIITKHILPNIMAPVIVISAANFAASILIESGLSFLGLGAQPPMPSWGSMIKDHYQYIILDKAYLAIVPGIAIMTLVMAFMLLGNALRDALDVKTS
ncbi:MAG: ABC transporter permease, partial [Nonlabens sp.]